MAELDRMSEVGWLAAEMLELVSFDKSLSAIKQMLQSKPEISPDIIDEARICAIRQLCESVRALESWRVLEKNKASGDAIEGRDEFGSFENLAMSMAETMVWDGCADTMYELLAERKGISYEQFHQIKKRAVQRLHERANLLDVWNFGELF